ncbi:hypothetical protein JTB14_031046 [Gonioctena quinquepunctata]|nr:hypothetical protein JTB14_031046 [Gonioctena quinquepunctata]
MTDKDTSKTIQFDVELDPNFQKGQFTFIFPNGDKYQGEYCAHRSGVVWREGYGTYTTIDGQSYSGLWVDDKLVEEEQLEIRYPNGSEYYGNLLENKYNGPALYVVQPKLHLLCQFSQNKPFGALLLVDPNGREWYGTAGETEAVLLPEHVFFGAIPGDLGKGRLRKKPPLKDKSANIKAPKKTKTKQGKERMKELELKIFAKSKKTVSDLKFEESDWYQSYVEFKKVYEDISAKVERGGEDLLQPGEKEWYGKYLEFKGKYTEILDHRKHKEKNLEEFKLFELYNSEEYKNSCPPIPVFYPNVPNDGQSAEETRRSAVSEDIDLKL